MESLPEEVVVKEILTRVASSSLKRLFNLSLVCKSLHKFSNDPQVLEHVCLDEIKTANDDLTKASSFLKKCRESGNTEALVREGIVKCFYLKSNIVDEEKGIECLGKAASKGHKAAPAYLCGVISFVRGGEVAQKIIEIFKSSFVVKSSALKTRRNLQECLQWMGSKYKNHFGGIRLLIGSNCVCHGQSFIWEKDDCPLECESCLLYTENASFVFFSHRLTEKRSS